MCQTSSITPIWLFAQLYKQVELLKKMDPIFPTPSMADFQAMLDKCDKITRAYQAKVAQALVNITGIELIPNEHLQDHQYMVSQGLYDSVQKLIAEQEKI